MTVYRIIGDRIFGDCMVGWLHILKNQKNYKQILVYYIDWFMIKWPGHTRTANSNLNLKELDHFAEFELELEKIFFLNLNSNKTVRVHQKDI